MSTEPSTPPFHVAHNEPDLNRLAEFVVGRLSDGERAREIEHLADCVTCRTIVASLMKGIAANPVERRWTAWAVPLAATLAIVVSGASLYRLAIGSHETPASEPTVTQPAPSSTPLAPPAPPGENPHAPSSAAPSPPTPARPQASDAGRVRAGATRKVAGREFHLEAGEWIDNEYRVADFFPVVAITSREALADHPSLGVFVTLGPRFTVVVDNMVYRVSLPPLQP
jgi:hypothetical protein